MIDFRNFFLREEKGSKLIVIFPGRFQPFHTGHKKYYEDTKRKFSGADCYIATASNTSKAAIKDPEKYPFSFKEKEKIITATGIFKDEVVECKNPYTPVEILNKYNKDLDRVIFLVGKKDMETDPRFAFTTVKSGAPSYFQKFTNIEEMTSFAEHGYVYAPGTITFDIDGKLCTGATELRDKFKAGDDKTRQRIIASVIGHPDKEIYNLFLSKIVT